MCVGVYMYLYTINVKGQKVKENVVPTSLQRTNQPTMPTILSRTPIDYLLSTQILAQPYFFSKKITPYS